VILKLASPLLLALLLSAQNYIVPGRPRPAAAGGDCTDHSNLEVFYLGSDLGTVSSAVSAWSDSSGNGNDMSQATGDEQGTVATLGTGKSVLFDGSNDSLEMDSVFTATGVFTIATVVNADTVSSTRTIVGGTLGGGSSAGKASLIRFDGGVGGVTEFTVRTQTPSGGDYTAADAVADDTTYIVVAGRKSDDSLFIYIDGVDASDGNSRSGTIPTQRMGRDGHDQEPYHGEIGTTCVWLADHEASEQTIHDYLDTQH